VTAGLTTTVEGDEALAAGLRRAADGLGSMGDAGAQVGQLIKQRATSGAPVDTGALSRSVHADVRPPEVIVGAAEPYARYVEYGTVYVPAQPFLAPALEGQADAIADVYADEAQHLLDQVRGA